MIQIPELQLKALIDEILKLIRSDYNQAPSDDKSQTVLFKIFGNLKYGKYSLFDNAVRLFISSKDDPNAIDTRLLYDRERAGLPTIHVTIPVESGGVSDGIGLDVGFNENTPIGETPTTMSETYNRTYGSRFNIVITGRNTYEVLVIFYVLKITLYNNIESLESNGFRNAKIYGLDLKLNEQMLPNVYLRILVLDSFYELIIPQFGQVNICNSINFNGTAYDN